MSVNKNLHSKTVLTEFSRDFEDPKDTVISKIVNKIYSGCNSQDITSAKFEEKQLSETPSISEDSMSAFSIPQSSTISTEPIITSEPVVEYKVDTSLGRTPLNVVKRISNLIAMKDKDLNDYKNTELQKLWMPDNKSRECYDCALKFNTFRRKHHCRLCGQIFCSKCCNQIIPGKIIKCSGELRVCNYCSKVVLSYLKSADINKDLKSDLQALEDDLSSKFVSTSMNVSGNASVNEKSTARKVSLGYQEERLVSNPNVLSNADRKSILQQSNSLKTLYEEMARSVQNHNKGIDLVNFLINNQKFATKQQAIAVLNAMIEGGFIHSFLAYESTDDVNVEDTRQVEFNENVFYKLPKIEEVNEEVMMQRSVSYTEEFESVEIIPSSINARSLTDKEQELQSSILSTVGSKPLLEAYCEHEELMVGQLLRNENLKSSWSKILINQCARIAHTIHPEYCQNDSMDIRSFVNIKKIPSGLKTESTIVGGVVFTKNVSHKDMKTRIEDPKILLIQCPIAYQRVEGKFVTIESLILQEKEYLRNVTSRILSYGPDVVLVHKNVSGIAQDMLRSNGITLVQDVKLSVFDRLAQCLRCDVVSSIDSNIGVPKLGTCKNFFTKSFPDASGSSKTLMFFDIPYSQTGCSLILRGGSDFELARVKKVASFVLFARYNFRLELSYLLDVFAKPPQTKSNPCAGIFDFNELNSTSSVEQDCSKVKENKETVKSEPQKKEKLMCIENVADFSDPLRATDLSPEIYSAENVELEVQHQFDNKFRTALSSTILSISPFITFPLPYFETEKGKKCALRSYFPAQLFYSKQWSYKAERVERAEIQVKETRQDFEQSYVPHNFLLTKITASVDHKDIQTSLSDYRRNGGRFKKILKMEKVETKLEDIRQKGSVEAVKDALDINSHDRLPVLFCSYYYNTRELPTSFCAQPLLLDMHFYGQDDIMLGLFLERYCFSSYICPSCKLPMMNHVRKYAHSMGVVTVKLAEDPIKNENSNILITSRCTICNTMTPSVHISKDTWCLSFAKYLELKFHGHSYTRRNIDEDTSSCSHSVHKDHIQYFSSNGIIVSFSFTPVDIWEVKLPDLTLKFESSEIIDKKFHSENIKSFSVKGYEVYAKIHEKLANLSSDQESSMVGSLKRVLNRDQLIFKHRVEVVYTLLSSTKIDTVEIDDAMLVMKQTLADSIELWGPRLSEAAVLSKHHKLENVQHLDQFEEADEYFYDNELDLDSNPMCKSNDELQVEKKDKIDKKTIKHLLSTLLPSSSEQNILPSPFSSNEHYCLPPGQIPILVHDQDLSSIIAYSLMSYDYKKYLEALSLSTIEINGSNGSPNLKRGSQNDGSFETETTDHSNKEATDKKKQNTKHVEIFFQDSSPCQFSCKIYLAKEFDELRTSCLILSKQNPPTSQEHINNSKASVDENRKHYARSLSRSQMWEARGGKSGSKFSKTSDDRFILKEMSKQDVGEFEKFAPQYFSYVNDCIQKSVPTLLAKIFGVYKVVIKKKECMIERSVLVIENLFCDRKIFKKYDLKGSERNRLVDPTGHTGETVLLDENLVKASWTKPLYILSHSRAVLREAICRDASFLEKNYVMDYSLLVGLDDNFLIVGIIDYIRKFTIDKRIESYLKQVVDQSKLPTIVSPIVYKTRFIEAMDKYFLVVPDRWEGLIQK